MLNVLDELIHECLAIRGMRQYQCSLSGLYEIAGEVPAPERLVPTFRNSPRMVWPLVRLSGPQIATNWSLRVE
jgi:hypothetical protein